MLAIEDGVLNINFGDVILIYFSSFSGSKIQKYMILCAQSLGCVQLFVTSVSLSMEFSKQEHWSG